MSGEDPESGTAAGRQSSAAEGGEAVPDEGARLANSVIFDFHDAIAALPGSTAARRLLVAEALQYLDRLAAERRGDAALTREIAEAYRRIGDVQGHPGQPNLGELDAAAASYRKTLDLYAELRRSAPADRDLLAAQATAEHRLADLLWWSQDTPGAVARYRAALALRTALWQEAPDEPGRADALAKSRIALGDVFTWNGDTAAAREEYARALAVLAPVLERAGGDRWLRRRLGVCVAKDGNAIGWGGDSRAAVARVGEGLAILEAVAAEDPLDTEAAQSIVLAHTWIAENRIELEEGSAAVAAYERKWAAAKMWLFRELAGETAPAGEQVRRRPRVEPAAAVAW